MNAIGQDMPSADASPALCYTKPPSSFTCSTTVCDNKIHEISELDIEIQVEVQVERHCPYDSCLISKSCDRNIEVRL